MNEEQLKDNPNSENTELVEATNEDSLVNSEPHKKEKKKKGKVRNTFEWIFTGIFAVLFVICGIGQINGMMNRNKHYGQMVRFGFGSYIVQTSSMEPVYKTKSAIITYLEDPDVIYKRFNEYQSWNASQTDEKKMKYIDLTFFGIHTIDIQPDDEMLNDPSYPKTPYPVTHRLREMHIVEGKEKGQGKYVFVCAGINTKGELSLEHQYQAFTEKELLGTVKVGSVFLGGVFYALSSPWGLLIFLLIPALYLIITSTLDIFRALKEPDEEAAGGPDNKNKNGPSSLEGLSEKDKERLKKELLDQMMKGKK